MDPYKTLGITPAYEGDLRALRNRLVKRHFEAGEAPDEERMKAINAAYELLSERPRPAEPLVSERVARPGTVAFTLNERGYVVHAPPISRRVNREAVAAAILLVATVAILLSWLVS